MQSVPNDGINHSTTINECRKPRIFFLVVVTMVISQEEHRLKVSQVNSALRLVDKLNISVTGFFFFLFLTGSSGFDPCRAWSCSRSTWRCKQQLKTGTLATHKRLKCWKWKRSRYLAKNIYAEVTQHRSCDHRKPQEIRTISQNKSKWSI